MTRVIEWIMGIIGAIAAFMGAFILFGDAEQYVGLGGDLTWRVGEIDAAWGYGLLGGGLALLAVAVVIMLSARRHPHVRQETSERAGLITHIVVFLLVNAFLWIQDFAGGGGLEYAYWTTIPWGVALLAHIVTYTSSGRHAATPHPTG